MKLNPIKTNSWRGTPQFAAARTEAINKANVSGEGYDVVRTLQQISPIYVRPVEYLKDGQLFAAHTLKELVDRHIADWQDCTKCRLGQCPFVINKCFFRGYLPCDVLFIGEAPGQNEDTHARPFIGEAGRCLDDIIKETSRRLTPFPESASTEAQQAWYRKDNQFRWCITNTVLCLPYDQGSFREPAKDEVEACQPRLMEFIELASPKLVCIMGLVAHRSLRFLKGVPTIYINHPSWFARLKNSVEKETELKKAAMSLAVAFNKHCVPF